MALKDGLVLPYLQPKVNYHSFPRRYEDTKPAIVADFTHRRIIDLGHGIEEKTLTKCSQEKEEDIHKATETIWEKAEVAKQEAVAKALAQAQAQHENELRKLNKSNEKNLKKECARVETEMKAVGQEHVRQTVLEWDQKLQEALDELEMKCDEALKQAATKAREEEQEAAKIMKEVLIETYEQKMADKIEEMEEQRMDALKAMAQQKDLECERAVEAAVKREEEKASKEKQELRNFYVSTMNILQTHLQEKKDEIRRAETQILATLLEKDQMRKELLETRDEFEMFIHIVWPYNKTQPGFVLPPPKTISFDWSE